MKVNVVVVRGIVCLLFARQLAVLAINLLLFRSRGREPPEGGYNRGRLK